MTDPTTTPPPPPGRKKAREYTPRDILTAAEVAAVIADLRRRMKRFPTMNATRLIVFELATCAGLRASEIAGLKLRDVRLDVRRPYIFIPGEISKGSAVGRGHDRTVPATWTPWLVEDLAGHVRRRQAMGAGPADPLLVSLRRGKGDRPLDRFQVRDYFIGACRNHALGASKVTTHTGRHTFVSHALATGHSPASVRAAAGHSSLAVTSLYAHAVDDPAMDGRMFSQGEDHA